MRTVPLDGWRTERVFEEFLRPGREGRGEAGEGKFISMGHVKTLPRKEARVSRLPERVDNRGSSRRRLTLMPFLDHRCSALGQRVCTGCVKSFSAPSLWKFCPKSMEPLPRSDNTKYITLDLT